MTDSGNVPPPIQADSSDRSLTSFLREHRETILTQWAEQVLAIFQSKGVGYTSSREALTEGMDHFLAFLLDHIDRGVEFAETQHVPSTESSTGAAFSFSDVLQVQAQLKAVVHDLLTSAYQDTPDTLANMHRTLEEAISETTFETASLYYQMSEHELKESRRETQEVAAVCRMTTAIISSLDRRELCRAAAKELPTLFPFRQLRLAILNDDRTSLRQFQAALGDAQEPQTLDLELTPGSSYEWVISNRKPHLAKDLSQATDFFDDTEDRDRGMRSRVVLPISSRDDILGVLDLVHADGDAYSERDIPVLWQIASQLGVALACMQLLAAERKRSAQLRIVSEVAKHVGEMDVVALLKLAANAIRESFSFFDVAIFLLSPDRQELILTAQAGAYEDVEAEGYRQPQGVGMVGWVAEHAETLVANDVTKEPRRIVAFDGENLAGSEMCVPITVDGKVAGVINIEATDTNAFDVEDVRAVEMISQEIGTSIQWTQLRSERSRTQEALDQEKRKLDDVIDMMGAGLSIINKDGRITRANRTLLDWLETSEESVVDQLCCQIFRQSDKRCTPCNFQIVRDSGKSRTVEQVITTPSGLTRYLQHVYAPLPDESGEITDVIKLTQDVTQNARRVQQLSMLQQLSQEMQGALDLDQLLYLILTCVTAGHQGLGFNRALLFLLDSHQDILEGRMAVGPADPSDAHRAWQEIEERHLTLHELAFRFNRDRHESSPLNRLVLDTRFSLDDEDNFVVACLRGRDPVVVRSLDLAGSGAQALLRDLGGDEFVCVPLVARDSAVGVVLADHRFTGRAIVDADVLLLSMFANQAGLAIERADAYRRLEEQMRQLDEAHDELMRAERLAVVGELAAHVAHEIRNPLVTIGGFARSILRQEDLSDRVRERGNIIVQEVERLERILKSVMDFTKPVQPVKQLASLNSLVEEVVDELWPLAEDHGLDITYDLTPDLEPLSIDPDQIKQVLINIVKNGLEAVVARQEDLPADNESSPASIHLHTRGDDGFAVVSVRDNGIGMSPEVLENIFDPFYTIKVSGTGLGLAVTHKIVTDHGGTINVESEEGLGSTFEVLLPLRGPQQELLEPAAS